MINTDIISFREKFFSVLEQTIKFNKRVKITTKDGNAILMSESDYNNIMATLKIYNNPNLHKKIVDGLNTPVFDGICAGDIVDICMDSYDKRN